MALFERGQALTALCNKQLNEAELKVKQITSEGEIDFTQGE
jgi:exodeoxyribonuclease VII small subunit